jgi:hypothetical protein
MNPIEQQFSTYNENASKHLSINTIPSSPIGKNFESENEEESDTECSTPYKGLNSTSDSTKPKSELPTYSTPLAPISIQKRQPRVNFHSIDDIVNGGSHSYSGSFVSSPSINNDSGISSFIYNSSYATPFFNQHQSAQIYNKVSNNCSNENGSFNYLDDKENDESNRVSVP